ncbi:MAG TPA: AAA family ATPase, partial [Azospirillaceae bacterium]|nr:AAA family ATPase [Azospirillaceae bacterium]
ITGIGLIRALAKNNQDDYFQKEGGASTFVHGFIKIGLIEIQVGTNDSVHHIKYCAQLKIDRKLNYENQNIFFDGKNVDYSDIEDGFLLYNGLITTKNIAYIRIYKNRVFGREMKPRWPQPADLPNDFLSEDYANLGLILSRIRQTPSAQRLVEWMQVFDPAVTDYNVLIVGGVCQIFLEEGDRVVPAGRLSDGALQYLCLLAVLCDPEPPPLVCIEEPEIGLHPDVVARLGDLLREASTRTQIIVTTHSESLVDSFSDAPECVIACEKRDGATVMNRLDRENLKEWLEKYSLGELWARGHIGANKW